MAPLAHQSMISSTSMVYSLFVNVGFSKGGGAFLGDATVSGRPSCCSEKVNITAELPHMEAIRMGWKLVELKQVPPDACKVYDYILVYRRFLGNIVFLQRMAVKCV